MTKITTITDFTDACEAALHLHDQYGAAHAAACLNQQGRVVELTPFDGPDSTVDNAVGWAHCMLSNHADIASVVFLSAGQRSVADLPEAHLEQFCRLRTSFDERGVPVHDWILCDGENLRSMAITTGLDQRWPQPAAA